MRIRIQLKQLELDMKNNPSITVVLKPVANTIVKKPTKKLECVTFEVSLHKAQFSSIGAVQFAKGECGSEGLEITLGKKAAETIHTQRKAYYEKLTESGVVKPTHMGMFVCVSVSYKVKRKSFLLYAAEILKSAVDQASFDIREAKTRLLQAEKMLRIKKRTLKKFNQAVAP